MLSAQRGRLGNFGVYALSDGTEAVAVPEVDGCHLFEKRHGPARSRRVGDYVVYRSGFIRRGGDWPAGAPGT